jgi:hypothetical protein
MSDPMLSQGTHTAKSVLPLCLSTLQLRLLGVCAKRSATAIETYNRDAGPGGLEIRRLTAGRSTKQGSWKCRLGEWLILLSRH